MTDNPPRDNDAYDGSPLGPDDTEDLAKALLLSSEDLVELAGGPWWRVRRDTHLLPQSLNFEDVAADWYVAGEPLQVLLSVAPSVDGGHVAVHLPKVAWDVQIPVVHPGHEVGRGPIGRDLPRWLPDALAEAQRRRRSTFRWCRYCRTLQAPEHIEDGVCHACMALHQGVVF